MRLQITLQPTEADALISWAAAELQDPREQIRFALRQALESQGLLPNDALATTIEEVAAEGTISSSPSGLERAW